MPVDPTKKAPLEIQELPASQDVGGLTTLVNDRIRALNEALKLYIQNPAIGSVNLGTQQIVNLADPKNDLDAVNLRTLKKFAGGARAQEVATGDGIEEPTIYFEFDGLPFGGEASPFAPIMANRDGFSPTAVVVSAVGAPLTDCEVNLTIAGVNMLAENLVLPAGSNGPIFTSAFALGGALPIGTLIQAVIVVAGGASQVTIGLALRGS